MPPSAQPRVFRSYARKDGAPLAQRLQIDLKEQGFDAWLDTQRITGGATWTTDIEHALDGAEFVLVLMTSGSYVSEICRAEQHRCLRKGRRLVPVLAASGADRPLNVYARRYRDFFDASNYDVRLGELTTYVRGNNVATDAADTQAVVTQ